MEQVDDLPAEVIGWLTGYSPDELQAHLDGKTDFETFFAKVGLNPARELIKGVVCGIRVEEIEDPLMRREIRYLDELIDELAKGKAMEKILRA